MKTLSTALIILLLSTPLISQDLTINQNQLKLSITLEDGLRMIQWTTSKEVNSSCFIIERKVGNQPFEIIKIVKAKGYSTVQQEYDFEDVEQFSKKVSYKVSMMKMGGELDVYALEDLDLNANGEELAIGTTK